ncbi:hypothetical protein AKJ49_01820 [candidate division MSBL1 archaeon SCGC-AAA382A03]|uniref:Saccharopine dehydrogenase NADP binding domain-containing protein n=1 Tax=candidate division MSBL1 archaeon SCGC-AAA382A03 TaxID=1698278 RepID=A0A133VE30_9EURY|nr:hypothetical protein AKJ49_01820 [candidate division MSBL1 archaeon SCGC-AAA382A03]
MDIIVLGCGSVGSGVVRDLVSDQSDDVDRVIVSDFREEEANKLVSELGDDRLEVEVCDVSNTAQTRELLDGKDVCVNCIPTRAGYQMDIMKTALKAKCPYVDIGGLYHTTLKQKKLHEDFAKAGVPALLGMGAAPGSTNILAKRGADRFEKVSKIEMYAAWRDFGPESPVFVPPYSILTLLDEYSEESIQYIDGEFKSLPPCSGEKVVDFPDPIGKMECFHTIHSEPATVPNSFEDKGVEEVTWRLGVPESLDNVMRSLISVGFGSKKPLELENASIEPEKFLQSLIWRNIKENEDKIPEPESLEEAQVYGIHRAIIEGTNGGEFDTIYVDIIQEPHKIYEGYSGALTDMSASIGAQIVGQGKVDPGVWAPEECINPQEYFEELKKRKFIIRETAQKEV